MYALAEQLATGQLLDGPHTQRLLWEKNRGKIGNFQGIPHEIPGFGEVTDGENQSCIKFACGPG